MSQQIPSNAESFDDFRLLASATGLSKYERIGFPDEYREPFEEAIFNDIGHKLTNLQLQNQTVLDVGPGCSDLPKMLIKLCQDNSSQLVFIDSQEMLEHHSDHDLLTKVSAKFPDCPQWINANQGKMDAILCYSVLQYAFVEGSIFTFFDSLLRLLAPSGQLLIGDIPNVSMRKRFFFSENGKRFHKAFMKTEKNPVVEHYKIEQDQIDDSVMFALLYRARCQGFNSFICPQNQDLPFHNRREDILVTRP